MRILSFSNVLVDGQCGTGPDVGYLTGSGLTSVSLLLTLTSDPTNEDKRGLLQRTNHNYIVSNPALTGPTRHQNLKTPPKSVDKTC